MTPDLIVILETDFAEHLKRIADAAPVWIVNTPANYAECERLWNCDPHPDYRETGAVTCYKTVDPEDRLGSLIGILPTLESHHGEVINHHLRFPDGFTLEVIGLALTDNALMAVKEAGEFTSFVGKQGSFLAIR